MALNRKIYKTELDGENVTLEISELAGRANAAVLGHLGETAVLATVVMANEEKNTDFVPLTVDYEERFYAAGKIIGSRFIRREGRPSDEAALSARLIDHAVRPFFDKNLRREVQVVITILAYDEKNDPDAIALLAASTALGISSVPWDGPIAGVKISTSDKNNGECQAFFAGPENVINMIEFEGKEIAEQEIVKLFEEAQGTIKKLVGFQKEIIKEIGKPKIQIKSAETDPQLLKTVNTFIEPKIAEAIRTKKLEDLKAELVEKLKNDNESSEAIQRAGRIFEKKIDEFVHGEIIEKGKRSDGRAMEEVRPLYSEINLFKRTHGSALFMRGETQILAITTLAPPSAEQLIETMETSGKKRFMLHYNFPKFAVGETGRSRGPGRREIGHGALAAKAVNAIIPPKSEFPYTIRVVAETLSSNGSSSMASACATSLSLMDAGVPIKKHVAGIAMGLMINEKGEYKILTDIQGPEDHHGDMDLKVAGTDAGVTAIQMDTKIAGITQEIFTEALAQAKKARLEIIENMAEAIAKSNPNVSPYAPTIITLQIPPEKIGEVIGPGGKTINGIIAAVGNQTTIDIEQTGNVYVASVNAESAQKAFDIIKQITREYHLGEIVEGEVIKILDFGAIVDLGGGRDGMIHISELKSGYVEKVQDVVKLGDYVKAKIVRVEEGKIALSLKNL